MKNEAEQVHLFDRDIWSGRTSPERFPATEEKTSRRSSRKSAEQPSRKPPMCLCLRTDGQKPGASTMSWGGGALLGEYTTPSFGESPNEENVSRLSQILEDSAPRKYYLSAKACAGVLNRAERRGKALPPELKEALMRQEKYLTMQSASKETESTEQIPPDATEEDGAGGAATRSIQSTDPRFTAVDFRNGTENERVNGTLQAKTDGGMSLNLANVVREL